MSRSGSLLTVKIVDEDGEAEGEETVKFDNKQRPIEETQIDEEGNIAQRSVYEYDGSDQLVSRIDYGENNQFLTKTTFTYNDEGKLVQSVQRTESGNLINSVLYEYDASGNRTLLQNSHHQQKTTYDDQNRVVIEETINRSNNLVEGFTEYKYDDDGLLIEERTFEMGESYPLEPMVFGRTKSNFRLTRYEYEFF
jgi:YD repeat-containing protein